MEGNQKVKREGKQLCKREEMGREERMETEIQVVIKARKEVEVGRGEGKESGKRR